MTLCQYLKEEQRFCDLLIETYGKLAYQWVDDLEGRQLLIAQMMDEIAGLRLGVHNYFYPSDYYLISSSKGGNYASRRIAPCPSRDQWNSLREQMVRINSR